MNREAVEDFFYHEAALLDAWDLDGWMDLLCDDACYLVPPNDVPDGDPDRIRGRVKRLKSRDAHAEFPRSRTRRLITNVRILAHDDAELTVTANFSVHRFRRGGKGGEYVGRYIYTLRIEGGAFRIAERRAILDAEELGGLSAVSFIL